jgi:hypothetical protein
MRLVSASLLTLALLAGTAPQALAAERPSDAPNAGMASLLTFVTPLVISIGGVTLVGVSGADPLLVAVPFLLAPLGTASGYWYAGDSRRALGVALGETAVVGLPVLFVSAAGLAAGGGQWDKNSSLVQMILVPVVGGLLSFGYQSWASFDVQDDVHRRAREQAKQPSR